MPVIPEILEDEEEGFLEARTLRPVTHLTWFGCVPTRNFILIVIPVCQEQDQVEVTGSWAWFSPTLFL